MSAVLDAHAVFVYLEKEPGYNVVRDAFAKASDSGKSLLMTTVNWGEVYYGTLRELGAATAEKVVQLLASFPIELVDVDCAIAKQAGRYKSGGKMSYADCFAAALAKLRRLPLITGDKEFKTVETDIKIVWLR